MAGELRSTVIALRRAELAPPQISEVISAVADSLVRRVIELALESAGASPGRVLLDGAGQPRQARAGSVLGRRLGNGLAGRPRSDPPPRPSRGARLASSQTARYMRAIAQDVADSIRVLGWRLDPHGVTASGLLRQLDRGLASERSTTWLARPSDNRVLIAVSILLDGRIVYGPIGGSTSSPFSSRPAIARCSSGGCCGWRWPQSRRRASCATSSSRARGSGGGPSTSSMAGCCRSSIWRATRRSRVDIRRQRHPAPPARRGGRGNLRADDARVLEEAYELFSTLRLEHQVAQLEEGSEPDDRLDPQQLDPLTRRYLRDAFREVAAVQRRLPAVSPSRR